MASEQVLLGRVRERAGAATRLRPRGFVIDGGDRITHEARQLVDAAGVAVARWSQRLFRDGADHLPGLVDDRLKPLLRLTADVLIECGALGPTVVHAFLRITATDSACGATRRVFAADRGGELRNQDGCPIELGATVSLPLDEDAIREQGELWIAELGRHAGFPMW